MRTLNASYVEGVMQGLDDCPVVLLNLFNRYAVHLPNVVSFTNNDIWQTVALVEKAAYVLTVDTAVAHIAQAFDKPMTVLFSLKNYENEPSKNISLLTLWGPNTPRAKKLYAQQSVNQIALQDIVCQTRENWNFKNRT